MQKLKPSTNNRIRFDFPIHPISINQSKSFIDSDCIDTVFLANSYEKISSKQLTKKRKKLR